jgi:hypothetical protein
MARDSFVFYRSFFEAISLMPPEVQAEVYPALVEYALNGKEPKGLTDIAKGVFILIKPNIDASITRYENGKKCAKYGKLGGRPAKGRKTASSAELPSNPEYTLSFEEEIEQMRSDRSWNEPVCMKFHLSPDDLSKRLSDFLTHCKSEYVGKSHSDINDAKRHFCSWMRKAYAPVEHDSDAELPPPSYEFNGGFGGQDI